MPLVLAALRQGLPGARGDYPASYDEAAHAWASAVRSWASGMVPTSTTVAVASLALERDLADAFAQRAGAAALEAAFARFARAVGLGMAGYVAVPPPGQVGFAALFRGPPRVTRQDGIALVAGKLDVWMRTGTATLIAPPGTVVPWQ